MSHLSPDFDVLFLQHNEYPFQLFLKGEYSFYRGKSSAYFYFLQRIIDKF